MGGSSNRPSDNGSTNQLLKDISTTEGASVEAQRELDLQQELYDLLELHFQMIRRNLEDLGLELPFDMNSDSSDEDDADEQDVDDDSDHEDIPRLWELFINALARI